MDDRHTFNIIDTLILMRLEGMPDIHRDPCVMDGIRRETRSEHAGERTVERTPVNTLDALIMKTPLLWKEFVEDF